MSELLETIKTPEWKELFEVAKEWDYGSMHSHSEISNIIKTFKGTQKYYSIISKANKLLLEVGKVIQSIHKEGYQVVTPDEYVEKSIKHYDQGKRQITKGYKTLVFAPKDKMTEEGRKKYTIVTDKAMAINAALSGGCTEIKLLAKPQVLIRSGRN